MQDLILTNLSKIRDLKVISRSSMEKYASHPENLKVVGAELGVAHLLEGSVQRVGDQVLINLQLIEVATDSHLWAETYNRKIENVFEVEQEVANAVAKALHIQLTTPQAIAVRARQAANPQALDAFMRAEFAAMELGRRPARVKNVEAIEWYEKAIAADPNFALAYAQLTRALMEAHYFGGVTQYSATQLTARAEQALATARRLQPDLPEADLALSFIQSRAQMDFIGSIATLDRVIAAWPGDPRAYLGKAANLRHLGRFDEALTELDTALSLSPRDENLLYRRAQTLTWLRRFDEAEAVYRQMLELFPRGAALVPLATLVLQRRGDLDEVLALLPPDYGPATYWRAWLLARQGKLRKAWKQPNPWIRATPSPAFQNRA
ncbi:MAG: tetratricopeptide repeat protein [Rhodanobacteraceae bacterium]|nr:tetratricopeptide repeat protein [Rhodanobacteraceae bacterium]